MLVNISFASVYIINFFHWLADSVLTPLKITAVADQFEVYARAGLNKVWPQAVAAVDEYAVSARHPISVREDWPFMNPYHVLFVAVLYLTMVFVGPRIMKNREAFKLKTFSLFHNGMLVVISAYMCSEGILQAIKLGYSLFGNPPPTAEARFDDLARLSWIFYVTKPVEMIDTLIMVLKKNNRQISVLHVYHHISIMIFWWVIAIECPGGEGYFSLVQNSGVHTIMYSYYLLSSLGIRVWFKRYITYIQMFQFVMNMVQSSYDYYMGTEPKILLAALFYYMITLLVLFGNYLRKQPRGGKKKRKQK